MSAAGFAMSNGKAPRMIGALCDASAARASAKAPRREHRERRAVGDRHQEEEPVVHLDDRLQHRTTLEAPRGALSEADQAGGDGRQLVGTVTRKVPRGCQEQTVSGDRNRMRDSGNAV